MIRDDFSRLQHIGALDAAFLIHEPGLHTRVEKRVHAHIAGCENCAALLRVHRGRDRKLSELLGALDIPAPTINSAAVISRATGSREPVRAMGRGWRVAAAGALIFAAATAAAALPASPLHGFLVRVLTSGTASTAASVPARPNIVTGQSAPPGVFLTPDSSLDIVFLGYNSGLVHVRMVEGAKASLTSTDGGSKYRVSSDRIIIDQSPQSTFELTLPRSLRVVHIWAGGELTLDRLHRSLVGDTGSFTIPLSRARSTKPTP
ncbi:MAG: hypothetical protein M3Z18_07080 [Gemmatimonadota bacterium]|nr:hypothetical protein [Gemmatimonadota bacterium]